MFRVFALVLGIVVCAAVPQPLRAADAEVSDVRVGHHGLSTRLVIDVDRPIDAQLFYLANPARLVIDLPEVGWRLPARPLPADIGVLSRLRYGLFKPGNSRIVVDLNQPSRVHSAMFLPADAGRPNRVVIDLARATGRDFLASIEAPPLVVNGRIGSLAAASVKQTPTVAKAPVSASTPVKHASNPAPIAKNTVRTPPPATVRPTGTAKLAALNVPRKPTLPAERRKRIIVIDPGHGGVDPGAIGVSGIYEKHVTLAAARDLRDYLEKTGRFKVYLTRERDVFIRLRKRTEIAREKNADIFVSLHGDSIRNNRIRGVSVYTLSERASDKEAAELAERENKADLIAGIDLTHESADVTNILIDLAQRETMNQSAKLASSLVSELQRNKVRTLRNPHRFAGFAVLKAPDVPSVLIELGFLSNKEDERALRSKEHRRRIAQSIAAAVDRYFTRVESASR